MTVFHERRHSAEFILSEGNGHISRETVTIPANQTIEAGTILAISSQADGVTTVVPVNLAAEDSTSEAAGIAIYAATTGTGETTRIAAIFRSAEVNGQCLAWPEGITDAQRTLIKSDLASADIIVR